MIRYVIILVSYFLSGSLSSQILFVNKGTQVFVGENAGVNIGGTVKQDSGGSLIIKGLVNIKGNIENAGQLYSTGGLSIGGDILNNGLFQALSGTITLNGPDQSVGGLIPVQFYSLTLAGKGAKKLKQKAYAMQLQLNDRNLNTDTCGFFLLNDNPASLSRTTGFVSCSKGGLFFRKVKAGAEYLFPCGTSGLYSPMIIKAKHDDTLGVRFANADASEEGLSRLFLESSICKTNPTFYHVLKGDEKGGSGVSIFIPQISKWNLTATRGTEKDEAWAQVKNSSIQLLGDTMRSDFISGEYVSQAFLFARQRPLAPSLTGPDEICPNTKATYSVSLKTGEKVIWNASEGEYQEEQNQINLTWNKPGTAILKAVITDAEGCSSPGSKKEIIIHENPVAKILIKYPQYPFEDEKFYFAATEAESQKTEWMVDGKFVSQDSGFIYSFDNPGDYAVVLKVSNQYGCTDVTDTIVRIEEGIIFPDSFSPNGDGINDEIQFLNSGLQTFSLAVFDRWGVMVYSTENSKLHWDGRDLSGKTVDAGTYFFTIQAGATGGTFRKNGTISVFP